MDHRTDGSEIVGDIPRECLALSPCPYRDRQRLIYEHARAGGDALALGRRQTQIDRDRYAPQQKASVQCLREGDTGRQCDRDPLAWPASPGPHAEAQREATVAEWVAEMAISYRDWKLLETAVTQTKQRTEEFLIETKLQGSSRQI